MNAFWIWNSWLASTTPVTLELFVTHGEASELNAGTPMLMADILSALGVGGQPIRWSFERYRTVYFTDYPDSQDWEDRWTQAWRATIEIASVPHNPFEESEIGFDSIDESWRSVSDPSKALLSRCLILADFEDDSALERARPAVLRWAPSAGLRRALAVGKFPQLQIDLGERPREFYAEGAKETIPLICECESLGASLRFAETMQRLRDRRD